MIAIAHFIAISCYFGAAAVAALPFARRVRALASHARDTSGRADR